MKACAAGGSSLPPTAPKERNRSAAAPFNQYGAPGLGGAPEPAQTEERTAPRRLDEVEQDLQRGVEGTWTQSQLIVRYRESQRHGVSACLRSVLAHFFGKAKTPTEKCSSDGATRHRPADERHPNPDAFTTRPALPAARRSPHRPRGDKDGLASHHPPSVP